MATERADLHGGFSVESLSDDDARIHGIDPGGTPLGVLTVYTTAENGSRLTTRYIFPQFALRNLAHEILRRFPDDG